MDQDPDTIPSLARERGFRDRPDINVRFWPSAALATQLVPGELEFLMEWGESRALYQPASVTTHFSWGRIEVYLLEGPVLEMGPELDRRV